MNIEDDLLYIRVSDQADWFDDQAQNHKVLNRVLWGASTALSVAVAILANSTFVVGSITAAEITGVLAIILPAVTGYSVLRSPESLWVHETDMRNRLLDLKQKLILVSQRSPEFERESYELEYFAIMGEANKKWREIKEEQSNA